MAGCQEPDESTEETDYELSPMFPNQEIYVHQGRNFLVRTVSCCHRIVCLGYSIFEERSSLKSEYVGLSGREIGSLVKQGVQVKETSLEPLFCFLGDTTHRVFQTHPEILKQHHTIIVECTFLLDEDTKRAEETEHMHWKQLKPTVESHPDTLFVLVHFSLKYSSMRIRRFFLEYRNVHPMLIHEEIVEEFEKNREDYSDEKEPPRCRCFKCLK